jgi:uncharacterized phage protein (TIGR02218 family)
MVKKQLKDNITHYATVWTIVSTNGTKIGFTDCDIDIEFAGTLCRATHSFTARSFLNTCDINSTPLTIEGVIDGIDIKTEDIACGRLDDAEVEVAIIDYLNPEKFQILKRGYIARITTEGKKFTAEIAGAESYLQTIITQSYSDRCRACFGDQRCGLDIDAFSEQGQVQGVSGDKVIVYQDVESRDNKFAGGNLRFIDGSNHGLTYKVSSNTDGVFTLSEPPYFPIEVGNRFVLSQDCDKSLEACRRFGNVINFRGEPFI